jgi:hypothetical protein
MNNFKSNPIFQVADELLPEEVTALKNYKDLAYDLNAFLRGNKVLVSPDPIQYRQLDSAIRKSRVLKPIRLFRATFAEDFDRFVRDGIFHDPAYASTSLSESNLGGHFVSECSKRPIKLVISCPQGANAFYLELANDSGEAENECLLPRCGRYRIDTERSPVTETRAMAEAMGQNNCYHAQGFDALRIIELSLLVS